MLNFVVDFTQNIGVFIQKINSFLSTGCYSWISRGGLGGGGKKNHATSYIFLKKHTQPLKICIGPTIHIGRESWCLSVCTPLHSEAVWRLWVENLNLYTKKTTYIIFFLVKNYLAIFIFLFKDDFHIVCVIPLILICMIMIIMLKTTI